MNAQQHIEYVRYHLHCADWRSGLVAFHFALNTELYNEDGPLCSFRARALLTAFEFARTAPLEHLAWLVSMMSPGFWQVMTQNLKAQERLYAASLAWGWVEHGDIVWVDRSEAGWSQSLAGQTSRLTRRLRRFVAVGKYGAFVAVDAVWAFDAIWSVTSVATDIHGNVRRNDEATSNINNIIRNPKEYLLMRAFKLLASQLPEHAAG